MDRRLLLSIVLNGVIVVAEVSGGLLSGSLSLLSDAMHNLSDVVALAIALVARKLGRRPPSIRHTYGLGRVEVMAALFNGVTVLVVGTLVCREAVIRLMNPQPVVSGLMLAVGAIGLVANLASVFLLKGHGHDDLNMRGAFLHLLQDTLSSVVVVLAAVGSSWRYGIYFDPIASIVVILMIVRSGWGLLRDSLRVLLEATPEGLDIEELRQDVQTAVPGCDLHHLHVWELRPGQLFLTAHVQMPDQRLKSAENLLDRIRERLRTHWNIRHANLEPELVGCGNQDLLGTGGECVATARHRTDSERGG